MIEAPMVKIIATLGPSTRDPRVVYEMMGEGAWGFRLNTSHGSPEEWEELVSAVLETEERHGWRPALIVDLQGPRVRIARGVQPVTLQGGDRVELCYGGDSCIEVDNPALFRAAREGDEVIVGDGAARLRVEKVQAHRLVAVALGEGVIEPGKGVVVKGRDLPLPPLTERDMRVLEWVRGKPFSHVMLSYTRDPSHVRVLRARLRELGIPHLRVLAKIETPSAVAKAGEIAEASDGVVVARGDLGMHFPLEEMPVVQAAVAYEALAAKKPVIMATEILASMVERPVPTRSEITDIFEAVRLGSDALLLTAETAVGRHPVDAVAWARRAAEAAARHVSLPKPEPYDSPERLALGLVELAESLEATLVVYSREGRLPARVAAFKPRVPVVAGASSRHVERVLRLLWGVYPVHVGEHDYQSGLEATRRAVSEYLEGALTVEASWSRSEGVYEIRVRNIRY